MRFRALATVAMLLGCLLPAHGQQTVKLQFNAGQVSLSAQNAPIRAILAEWARLGGVTIVNADRVAGPPVTLELTGVPERQALDIVLRGVAGYLLAPRPGTSQGASAFDRIMILPTSVAPRNPPPPASAGLTGPRPVLPRPQALVRPPDANPELPGDGAPQDSTTADDAEPVVATPQPIRPPAIPRPFVQRPPAGIPVAPGGELIDPTDEPTDSTPGTSVAPTPTNPFGIPSGSSARPGVISPVPQQQPQRQPQQQNTPNRVQ